MAEPLIEVKTVECMGIQYIEVKTYGKTNLVLLDNQALDLFWLLATTLAKLRKGI